MGPQGRDQEQGKVSQPARQEGGRPVASDYLATLHHLPGVSGTQLEGGFCAGTSGSCTSALIIVVKQHPPCGTGRDRVVVVPVEGQRGQMQRSQVQLATHDNKLWEGSVIQEGQYRVVGMPTRAGQDTQVGCTHNCLLPPALSLPFFLSLHMHSSRGGVMASSLVGSH
jgi:hypothetical protein